MKIKDKVLENKENISKELDLIKRFTSLNMGIDQCLVELRNHKRETIKETLAEVGKVIDEEVSILKTGCQVLVNQIKKLKGEKKKFVFKQAELRHIRIEELERIKQKLGIK